MFLNNIKKTEFLIYVRSIFLGLSFLSASFAYAAVLSVSPQEIPLGDETVFEIRIDTEGEVINALEMNVAISPENVLIVDAYEGRSIVSFWTQPVEVKDNSVILSGIIPGGFQGEGVVLTLRISGVKEGETNVIFSNISVMKNDGEGSLVTAHLANTMLIVSKDVTHTLLLPDTIPPEPFTVAVIRDESVERGSYVAVFATQDKQTGIAHYEIQETQSRTPEDGAWMPAISPYVLQDQSLGQRIFVRAIDRAGNITISEYSGDDSTSLLSGALYLILIVLAVLVLLFLYVRNVYRKKIRASQAL
jgi:hypothetical protein